MPVIILRRLALLLLFSIVFLSAGARAQEVLECDLLAASPFDPEAVTEGVGYDALDPIPAINACLAAIQSHPEVARFHFQMGRALIKQGDADLGPKAYQRAAELGSLAAMHNLGALYDDGALVEKNRETALQWYLLAAERDFAPSQTAIGMGYLKGDGLPQDLEKGFAWLDRAAAQGDEPALAVLSKLKGMALAGEGPLAQKGPEAAFSWLLGAAEAGYPPAMAMVAGAYDQGLGTAADKEQAIRWYRAAVEAGIESVAQRLAELDG